MLARHQRLGRSIIIPHKMAVGVELCFDTVGKLNLVAVGVILYLGDRQVLQVGSYIACDGGWHQRVGYDPICLFLLIAVTMTELYFAEREGFEPPVPFGTPVFKTGVIDHSTISPE